MLKIANIRTILTAPEGVDLLAVKVETSEPGLYGIGCATFTQRNLAVACVVEQFLRPLLLGRDPQYISDIWHTVAGSSYWRGGPVLNSALSGVDMALWDIKGKLAGMPLYQLWGGKRRAGVTAYTHVRGRSAEEVVQKAREKLRQGYRFLRCHTDEAEESCGAELYKPQDAPAGAYFSPNKYQCAQINMFKLLREEFGWDVSLCHDVHERLTPTEALGFAREMEPFHLAFLEDILAPEQSEWLERIRKQCVTPIAMGELFNDPKDWLTLVTQRRIDYIRCHISQLGGITPALKLIPVCDAFGVRTAWHGPCDITPVGHAVNIHLDFAAPNFGIQEWMKEPGERLREVFPGTPWCKDGFLYVTDSPGTGVDIDEEAAARYPCSHSLPAWTLKRRPDGTAVWP